MKRIEHDDNVYRLTDAAAYLIMLPVLSALNESEHEEIDMTTFTKHHSDFFYRALAAFAMAGSILLVFAADAMPEGLERGDFVVDGFGVVLAGLVAALVVRTAYAVGFRKALKIATAVSNDAVTA